MKGPLYHGQDAVGCDIKSSNDRNTFVARAKAPRLGLSGVCYGGRAVRRGLWMAGILTALVVLLLSGGWILDEFRIATLRREMKEELVAFYAECPTRPGATGPGRAIDHHLAALEQLSILATDAARQGVPYSSDWIRGREGPAFDRIAAGARCREIGLLPYAERGVVDCSIDQEGLAVACELVEIPATRETDSSRAVQRCLDLLRLTGDLGRSAHETFQHDLLAARECALRALERLASQESLSAETAGRIVAHLTEDLDARRDAWQLVRGQYLAQQVAFAHYLEQDLYRPNWAKISGKGWLGSTGNADADEVLATWRAWRTCGTEMRAALDAGDLRAVSAARARFREATVLEHLAPPGSTLETEFRLRAREEALVRQLRGN